MDVNIRFEGENEQGNKVVGHLLTNKIATYIITGKNPHECDVYGYIEIDEYYRVLPESVRLITE